MSRARGKWALFACDQCDDIFSRRARERGRFNGCFCSRTCAAAARRTPRVQVKCSCCGVTVIRPRWQVNDSKVHFCSIACRDKHQPIALFSAEASEASVRAMAPLKRSLIGRAGGIARARALTPERMSEIGKLAVDARKANGRQRLGKQRAGRARLAMSMVGPLITWRSK